MYSSWHRLSLSKGLNDITCCSSWGYLEKLNSQIIDVRQYVLMSSGFFFSGDDVAVREPGCWSTNMCAQVGTHSWHTPGDRSKQWGRGGERWWRGLGSEPFARPQLKFCFLNCSCQPGLLTKRMRKWWCHRQWLACRAAAASFPRRYAFSRTVMKELSSEWEPIW